MIASLLILTSVCFASDLKLLISPDEIAQKISQTAAQIDKDYEGERFTIIMVMKGAFCVTADLIRQLKTPTVIEYIKASSYGANGDVRGDLTITGLDKLQLGCKNVLIIDDIYDTGATMQAIVKEVEAKNPRSLKTLVLLSKNVPRQTTYRPDYVLFDIENHFVVGYGLDYKELHRGLPGIYRFVN